MAKRYLSLEEAAAQLGIPKDELIRHRERGDIRGFADRGTFKFKAEDVDELARRLQPSSDPGLQMLDGEDDGSVLDDDSGSGEGDNGEPSIIRRLSGAKSDSSVVGGTIFDDFSSGSGASDSDVRLVMDDRLNAQHDSDPDVMLNLGESDSDVRLSFDSDVEVNMSDSDSDVRLSSDGATAGDSVLKFGMGDSDSDVRLDDSGTGMSSASKNLADSDSDVQLTPLDSGVAPKPDSDSDVLLVGSDPDSDSDVHLEAGGDSALPLALEDDSDVRLITSDSDSDVRLLDDSRLSGPKSAGPKSSKLKKKDSDSDVALVPESGLDLNRVNDSDVNDSGSRGSSSSGTGSGIRGGGSSVLLDDSDIALTGGSGISLTGDSRIRLGSHSGIALERVSDSGVSLEKNEDDSGLSLFADSNEDDGITLAEDSGIALTSEEDDSGISLGDMDIDDGLTLGDTMSDSGIALQDDDEDDDDLELTATMPAMKIPRIAADDDRQGDTMLEVPSLSDHEDQDESDFEIGAADNESHGDTSVLLFDDEDETDDGGAAMVKKKKVADDEEEEEEQETFEFGEDEEDTAPGEEIDGEVEDVFAGDEAFDEDGDTGDSEVEFEVSSARGAVVAAGTIEYPWGAGVITTLAVSSICMLFCAMASIDLVRSMWGWQTPSPVNGWLIETLGGLFK